jgi:hypothetical protein
MAVKKFGRTTGFTNGVVEARIPTFTPIPYKARQFQATVWLKDIWSVRGAPGIPFALPGDSGSLVVTGDASGAVGVVFATAGSDYAFIIPMDHVVSCFGGLRLVDKHGV